MTDEIELDGNCKSRLERSINGAIKNTIHSHGPITLNWISSASKRVIGTLKGYNKYARERLAAKGRGKVIAAVNGCYTRWSYGTAGGKHRRFERLKVGTLVDFGQDLGWITDEEAKSIYEWERKWSIKPGPYRKGVNWKKVGLM